MNVTALRALGLSMALSAGFASQASYILTPTLPAGANSIVSPGGTVLINFVLSSLNGPNTHNSAIFRVTFSVPGLVLEQLHWSAPYETGSIFDDSQPGSGTLPVVITDGLLAGPGYPDNVADIELSNVAEIGTFGTGVVASISLRIPNDFKATSFLVRAVPDTFANGFEEITTEGGAGLTFVVVPAPGTGLAALSTCTWLLAKRCRMQRRRNLSSTGTA